MALANGLTPKQDAFRQAYLETGNACEAYRRAYKPKKMSQKAITVESTRLLKHPSISLAIENEQQALQERHGVTLDSLTQELVEDRKGAREAGQFSAAISAVALKAKLHGLIVDKSEVTRKRDVADLSDSELAAIATGRGTGTPAPSNGARGPDPVH